MSCVQKSIKMAPDLALNGAKPAFSEPLHVGRPHLGDRDELLRYTTDIYERSWLTNNGPLVQELEQKLAKRLGVKHCVAMCNGTVALEIAIRALGLHGEVIVPSYTFVATAHALHWQAITPVFADIDPATHNIDPGAVRRMITPRTTGIVGVHLWGRPAPIQALQSLADEHGLQLMFDAAHAFDCSHEGRKIGNFGRCEVFSFHATKVFNSFEGGAVMTNEDDLADAMRLMRNFGFAGYDNVIYPGTNGKMVEISAAMGLVNLRAMESFVAKNRENYQAYSTALSGIPGVSLLQYDEAQDPNYHYVVIEVDTGRAGLRDQIVETLHAENVLARKYFWPGCHRMKPYRDLFPHAGLVLPNTETVAASVIVLPSGSGVDVAAVHQIGNMIRVCCESS